MSIFKKDNPVNHDLEVFLIYDSKSNSYRDPIISPNQWEMVRAYENILRKNPDDQLCTNAEDFSIFRIGLYWKKTGILKTSEIQHIANLHEIKHSFMQRQKDQMGIVPT